MEETKIQARRIAFSAALELARARGDLTPNNMGYNSDRISPRIAFSWNHRLWYKDQRQTLGFFCAGSHEPVPFTRCYLCRNLSRRNLMKDRESKKETERSTR